MNRNSPNFPIPPIITMLKTHGRLAGRRKCGQCTHMYLQACALTRTDGSANRLPTWMPSWPACGKFEKKPCPERSEGT